jgi:hypothetical protein
MLEGRPFTIYMDHKPLTYALGKVADGWTAMQCQQLSYMAEFTTDICHVLGVDNVVADTLSRPPSHTAGPDSCSHTAGPDSCSHTAGAVSAVSPSAELLDYASIAKDQLVCPLTKKAASSSSLQPVHVNVHGQQLLCDVSRGGQRLLIPEVDRKQDFQAFHELSHPGRHATRRLMSARVIWRGMSSDIAAWCRDCQQFARGKASPQPAAPIQPIPLP